MKEILNKISDYEAYQKAFSKLAEVDEIKANNIRYELINATKESHTGINQAKDNPYKLRYWLDREEIAIKAQTSTYLSYCERMASNEANLWKFALNITEKFFDLIFIRMDNYFENKINIMISELVEQSEWYSTLTDTSKKLAVSINYLKKIVKATVDYAGVDVNIDEEDIVNTNTIVEEALSKHLDPIQVGKDIAKIMEEAQGIIKEDWENQIKELWIDLNQLKAYASDLTENYTNTLDFELGMAEQTLLVGLGGTLVGTFGLAAGWHTLAYSMVHVFPPIAIFSILATAGVAWITKDRALKNRQNQIIEAVNQFQKHFIMQIDTAHLSELKGKTLHKAMIDQSINIVQQILSKSQTIISGNLTAEHYRILINATADHLELIKKCRELNKYTLISKNKENSFEKYLVDMQEAYKEVIDLGDNVSEMKINAVLTNARKVLEAVFISINKKFNTDEMLQILNLNKRYNHIYNNTAASIGFKTPIPSCMASINPKDIKMAVNNPSKKGVRILTVTALLATKYFTEHPMKTAAIKDPELLNTIDFIADKGNAASHLGGEDISVNLANEVVKKVNDIVYCMGI